MKKKSLITAAILVSAATYAGNVFYWRVDHINDRTALQGANSSFFDWASFGDSSNWSVKSDEYSNPENLVPGEGDSLYMGGYMQSSAGASWTMGRFDLGGQSWTVGGYSSTGYPSSSFRYRKPLMALTNGTLTVMNPAYVSYMSHNYQIYNKATLIYPSGQTVTVSHANPYEEWTIESGGRIEARCGLALTYLSALSNPEGRFCGIPTVSI